MLMTSRLGVAALSAIVLIAPASARQTNTARIAGTVVTSDATPQPVRRAIVRLGGQGAEGRSAVTDDQGRFALTGLPAGRFTMTASKPAHLTTAYGASAPGRPGTAVTVAVGQSIANLRLVLPRGAAIAGTIRDRAGTPLPAVSIRVIRIDAPRSSAPPATNDVLTDDRGMFRAFGLLPGTYAVAAVPRLVSVTGAVAVPSASEMDALFRRPRPRSISSTRTSTSRRAPASAMSC